MEPAFASVRGTSNGDDVEAGGGKWFEFEGEENFFPFSF